MKSALNEKLEEYKKIQNEISRLESMEWKEQDSVFLKLKSRIHSFLNVKCGNIIKSISELFIDVTERAPTGRLTVHGILMPRATFDKKSCAELCGRLEEMLVRSARALSCVDRNDAAAKELVAKVYFCNNVLLDISESCRGYALEERREYDEELERRFDALNKKERAVFSELSSLGFSADGRFMLSASERVSSSYGDTISIPLGYTRFGEGRRDISVPATWGLSECGTVFIEAKDSELEDSGIEALIENTVLKFLFAYPASAKRVTVCDGCCSAELISFITRLSGAKGCSALFGDSSMNEGCPVYTTADSASRELSKLQINHRIAVTGGRIFEYNKANPENVQAPVLVILRGMGGSVNYARADIFNSLLLNGSKAGIFFLVIDTAEGASIIPEKANAVRYGYDKKLSAITDKASGVCYSTELRERSFTLEGYIKKLEEAVAVPSDAISFESLDRRRSSEDFSSVISIPIGKKGVQTVEMSLSVDGPTAHCVMLGMSGSGKSTLLHDMILGFAEKYSPSELEFWLFDFKNGSELTPYRALKHVKRMALNNKSRDASELMNGIKTQMRKRQDIIKAAGVNDIVRYNAKMRKLGSPLLTRILIVIDEYTEMKDNSCISDFELVARQGRSVGISFIISSVIYESFFKRITDQASHKIEFTSRSLGAFVNSYSESDRDFLSALKGNCIYNNGASTYRMRAAFVDGADGVAKKIEEINLRYPYHKYERPIIMGEAAEIGEREKGGDKTAARELYRKQRRISAELGRTRDGESVSLIMGMERAYAAILGDESRSASAELLLARDFSLLDDGDNVYYLDLYRSADRLPNAITDTEERIFRYASSNKDLGIFIKELYSELMSREEALDNGDPIGGPILLMLHGAEFLSERASGITKLLRGGDTASAKPKKDSFLSLEDEAESILKGLSSFSSDSDLSEGETDSAKMLTRLISKGSRVRIYAVIHYENVKNLRYMTEQLFDGRASLSDFIIIPPRLSGNVKVSAKYVTEYLAAAGMNTSELEKEGMISESELMYAYLISGAASVRFIPYEKKTEN